MAYQVVSTTGGKTMSDIAAENGIPFMQGAGFYQLLRIESVSAAKELVLYNGRDFITAGVREKLIGVGRAKLVNIAPHQVPEGLTLFVNSTSPNRRVDAGLVLFKTGLNVPAAAPGAKRGRTGKKVNSRRGKKKRSDDEGEEEDGSEGGEEGGLIPWGAMREMEDEELFDADMVKREEGAWADCDAAVPAHLLDSAFANLVRALREFTSWQLVSGETADECYGAEHRYEWVAPPKRARLMVRQTGELLLYAIEVPEWKFAIALGEAGSHPFIRATSICYDNSDGSGNGTYLRGKPTPEIVLANMMRDLYVHGQDGSH